MDSYDTALEALGRRARALRILQDLRQSELAARAGVSSGTVVRFEHTGKASIENVLRLATVLGAEAGFEALFQPPKYRSLDEALARPTPERQRVRRPRAGTRR